MKRQATGRDALRGPASPRPVAPAARAWVGAGFHTGASRRYGNRRPPAAFTLIEVLVSLAVFAAAAIVLGATYLNVITNYHAALQRPEAESVATLLRAGLLTEPDRKKARQGGELPLATGRTARWRATIEETAIADLFEVTLEWEIAAPGAAGAGQGRQRLMLLRPDWSDPTVREKLRAQSRQRLAERKF